VAALEVGVRRIDFAVFELIAEVMGAETVCSIVATS